LARATAATIGRLDQDDIAYEDACHRWARELPGHLGHATPAKYHRLCVDHAAPKAILIWEEVMPTLVGFGTFAALVEEQISERISRRILSGDQGMIVGWSIGAGVHVEPHSHANEQLVWILKGKMEFRLGTEQRVCGRGDVVVIPGGAEHEAWFREDTEVIDFFAPPREDFLLGGKPAYMSER
jgi:quercetin dioxygenase-like cupin family protein